MAGSVIVCCKSQQLSRRTIQQLGRSRTNYHTYNTEGGTNIQSAWPKLLFRVHLRRNNHVIARLSGTRLLEISLPQSAISDPSNYIQRPATKIKPHLQPHQTQKTTQSFPKSTNSQASANALPASNLQKMSLPNPRLLPAHLHAFSPTNPSRPSSTSLVRILGTISNLNGETGTLTCGPYGNCTLLLGRDSHLQVGNAYEIIGKVMPIEQGGSELGLRILNETLWGGESGANNIGGFLRWWKDAIDVLM